MSVKTLNDLLEIAIEHEISSQKFYQDALDTTRDPKVRHFLRTLISEEEGHERVLKSISEMKIYEGTVPVNEKALEHARRSHDLDIPDLSDDPSLDEIYDIALKRETRAYNIFTQMAMTTDNPELKSLFTNLAEEEQTHHKNIDKEYHLNLGEMGYEG